MTTFFDHTQQLSERYGRYLGLLAQVGHAIAERDARMLAMLESDCFHVLHDLQPQWMEFQQRLDQEDTLDVQAIPAVHYLRHVMVQAKEQASVNEMALAHWLGEVGSHLGQVKQEAQVLRSYEWRQSGHGPFLGYNA